MGDNEEPEIQLPGGWTEYMSNLSVTFDVATPKPIWVIKVPRGYVRIATRSGRAIGLVDRRLATRFDSSLLALTIATGIEGAKVVRLWTKSEREAHKAKKEYPKAYVWTTERSKPESPAEPAQTAAPEPAKETK